MRLRENLIAASMRRWRRSDPGGRGPRRYKPERVMPGIMSWIIYGVGFLLIVFGVLYLGRDVILRPWTARQWTGAAAIGEVVYVFGGQDVSSDEGLMDEVLAFDLDGHDVRIVGTLPWPAYRPQVCACDGRLYVLGGSYGIDYFSEILAFDPESGEFTVAGQLPSGRALGGAVQAKDTIYYVGGRDRSTYLDEVVAFDPATGESHVVAHLPTGVYSPAVTTIADRLYVIGGEHYAEAGIARSDRILEIDLGTGAVTRTATLPSARSWTAAAAIGDDIYVFGGWVGEPLDDIIRISTDSTGLEVEVVGKLERPMARHIVVTIDDHLVLIGGDIAARQRELPVIEIDPETLDETTHRFRGSV